MKKKSLRLTAVFMMLVLMFITAVPGCSAERTDDSYKAAATKTLEGSAITDSIISSENYKELMNNNTISAQFFCADPTAVEYNGRLYVYGTNDHQQFEIAGAEKDNSYEHIKSFVVFSTDDMVNWIYHGEINVEEIAPWITNSWAPSIVSRVEEDGKTHFYLYFSNNGIGVGVITATDPLGPWSDPLGKALIAADTEGLENCPNPFDPGVVIDDNGNGWLAFGGGKAPQFEASMPGSSKIVMLGEDMLSFNSMFYDIPAPWFFEASELNYINGEFVYTYCSDWSDHSTVWDYECDPASACSMIYMTCKMPRTGKWEVKGEYFANPGLDTNNHTHLHKFKDNYYIFYQSMMLKKGMGIKGAYRALGVDVAKVDEENHTIEPMGYTHEGVSSVSNTDAMAINLAADINNCANVGYDNEDTVAEPTIVSGGAGAWVSVRDVEFSSSELAFIGTVKGKGRIEVRVDTPTGDVLTSIDFDTAGEVKSIYNEEVAQISGVHDLYFIFSDGDIRFINWQFANRA